MDRFIGEYSCPKCGIREIEDPTSITITYPLGSGKPVAKIVCEGCGEPLSSVVEWEDALVFESRGANINGFSFATATDITEGEIEQFMTRFDKEIKDFLDVYY